MELQKIFFNYIHDEEVLQDVSLNIHKGDYLGIIGPNGGGKTTLLKIMLGLLKPQKGTVKLFGEDINNFHDWYKIGYVPQKVTNFDSNFPLTVWEVVSMGRYAKRGLFKSLTDEDREIIRQSLENVDMWQERTTIIGSLSGGQLQRIFIARALASLPEVILLDEPAVGVDVRTQELFYQLLQKLNNDFDLTLVLISHDINVVANVATEIAYINKTLIYDDNPKDFLKNDALKKIYGEGVKIILHNH